MKRTTPTRRNRSRIALGAFFSASGINHFVMPRAYRAIVPPGFGDPALVVAVSGVAEIAGGLGVLLPATRRASGWGLVALLIAIFPANIHMAVNPDQIKGLKVPRPLLWLRLPLQPAMMWWAWSATRRD